MTKFFIIYFVPFMYLFKRISFIFVFKQDLLRQPCSLKIPKEIFVELKYVVEHLLFYKPLMF